ncbi:MAG: hypothetical protein RL223_2506 [Pseudomonadota bacterium]|jgi:putative PEP-CTERM system TPR-repeat lipoprotein
MPGRLVAWNPSVPYLVTPTRALLLTTLSITLTACGGGDQKALDAVRDQLVRYEAGERKTAEPGSASEPSRDALAGADALETRLRGLTARQPRSGEARFLLGRYLLLRGDAQGARPELLRARELKHPAEQVVPLLARAMVEGGDPQSAIERYAETDLAQPEAQASLLITLSQAFLMRGELQRAEQMVQRALSVQPDAEHALLQQVRLMLAHGQQTDALRQSEQLTQRLARSGDAWALRADLLLNADARHPQAEAALRQAIGLKPSLLAPRAKLVALLLNQDRLPDAERELQQLRQLAPKRVDTVYFEGIVALRKGELARARTALQALLRGAPEHVLGLIALAEVEFQARSLEQAQAHAAKALSLSPTDPEARLTMARIQLRQGLHDAALVSLGPLLDKAQNVDTRALTLAAEAHLLAGRSTQAAALNAKARAQQPDDPALQIRLARQRLARHSERDAALADLQTLARKDSGTHADLTLIAERISAQEWPAALQAIEQLRAKRPDDALPYQLTATVLRRQDRLAEARAALDQSLRLDPDFVPAVLGQAEIDLKEGKADAARQRMEQFLARQPKNVAALLALATVDQVQNRVGPATRKLLERAVSADAASLPARLALISHLKSTRQIEAALTAAQAAAATMPGQSALLLELAHLQSATGLHDEALATAGRLLSSSEDQTVAQTLRAQILLAAGKVSEAIAAAQSALKDGRSRLEARAVLISAYQRTGKYTAALEQVRQVQQEQPRLALGWALEGELEMQSAHWDKASPALRTALDRLAEAKTDQVTPTGQSRGAIAARLYASLKRSSQDGSAQRFAEDWMKAHPKDHELPLHLADQAQRAGQTSVAEQNYRRVLAVFPTHVAALNNLSLLLAQQRKPGGLALIDQALAQQPDDSNLLDSRATVLAADNRLDDAIDAQRKALKRDPQDLRLRLTLVRLQIANGDKRQAYGELRRILSENDPMDEGLKREAQSMIDSLKS